MQIEYDLIQSPYMSWKNVHHLWLLFPAFSNHDEHFWKLFGFTENILVEPSEFLWC